jgi:hypothetical protein
LRLPLSSNCSQGLPALGADLRFRAELFLLVGAALPILLVAAAVNEYQTRFVLPVVPLLLLAGCAALEDISRARGISAPGHPNIRLVPRLRRKTNTTLIGR